MTFKNIEKVIKKLNKAKQDVANSLLKEAKFCAETLEKLKTEVIIEGVVTDMEQGDYSIKRENPALKSYNTTIKNYTSVIKQLNDMLPTEEKPKDDGFEKFGDD